MAVPPRNPCWIPAPAACPLEALSRNAFACVAGSVLSPNLNSCLALRIMCWFVPCAIGSPKVWRHGIAEARASSISAAP